MLWIFNVYAGYSGLQPLDDIYYVLYNSLLTVYAMGYIMLFD